MKKLSIEQKAQRYDEAIERAKKWRNAPNIDKMPTYGSRIIEEIFPELEESEGKEEKIRGKLIHLVKKSHEQGGYALHKWDADEMLTWLEKQGKKEQDARYENLEELLAADDIYQMAMNDEMVREAKEKAVNALHEMCIGRLLGFDKQGEPNLITAKSPQLGEQKPATMSLDEAIKHCKEKSCGNNACALEHKQLERWLTELKELKEQKPAWSKEDENEVAILEAYIRSKEWSERHIDRALGIVDELVNKCKSSKDRVQPQPKQGEQDLVLRDTFGYEDGRLIGMNEGIGLVLDNPEKYGLQKPVKWSKEDESVISLILSICNDFLESFEISPASTKVVKKDIDKIKNWLKSLKGRVGCEANCTTTKEWREEDEQHIDSLLKRLDGLCRNEFERTRFAISEDRDWLESLRPQKQWKPSEKQIMCLQDALSDYHRRGYKAETLETLLKQLKQL